VHRKVVPLQYLCFPRQSKRFWRQLMDWFECLNSRRHCLPLDKKGNS